MAVYDQPCRTERIVARGGAGMRVGVVGNSGRAMRSSINVGLLEGLRVRSTGEMARG